MKGINKPSFQRRSERPSSKPSVALHTQLFSFHAPAVQMGQRGRIHFSKQTAALFTWFPNWHIFCLCNVLDYNFSGPARKTSLLMINFNRAPLVVADWAMPRFRKRSVFFGTHVIYDGYYLNVYINVIWKSCKYISHIYFSVSLMYLGNHISESTVYSTFLSYLHDSFMTFLRGGS